MSYTIGTATFQRLNALISTVCHSWRIANDIPRGAD